MSRRHRLPPREQVFVASLLYHGFRLVRERKNLKRAYGYVIPATDKEDSGGIDFWIKMPKDYRIFPAQVTQRGVRMYRKYHKPSDEQLSEFIRRADKRIRSKQKMCYRYGIAFVLVRDYDGKSPHSTIAWGDVKALRHAMSHLKRRFD
ncbi:MAG: hypothetical protein RLZZ480_271 [Candidatus Parcubacteria bacterium]